MVALIDQAHVHRDTTQLGACMRGLTGIIFFLKLTIGLNLTNRCTQKHLCKVNQSPVNSYMELIFYILRLPFVMDP